MRVDVSITYHKGQLHTRSEAADYSESRPALILLSRGPDGAEMIEAIGQPFDMKMQASAWERDRGARTYRSYDPFEILRFDPDAAAAIVRHLCYSAHTRIQPARGLWRAFCGLDRFLLKVKIPDYTLVAAKKKADFERRLRKVVGKTAVSD